MFSQRVQVRAQPKIEQGILTLVFKGVGKHLLPCVCDTYIRTDRNGRLDYNKWTATVVLFQVGSLEKYRAEGTAGAPIHMFPCVWRLFLPPGTHRQTDRQSRYRHNTSFRAVYETLTPYVPFSLCLALSRQDLDWWGFDYFVRYMKIKVKWSDESMVSCVRPFVALWSYFFDPVLFALPTGIKTESHHWCPAVQLIKWLQ